MQNNDFLSAFIFSTSVTLPTLLMLMLGVTLRAKRVIDDRFSGQATKIIFNITLPVLLFLSIFKNPVDYSQQVPLLLVGVVGTLILFVGAEIFAAKFVVDKRERGTFVQSVYRGNNGILGLAFCINAYGDLALAPASIYAAALTFLYNILGVITLSRSLSDGKVGVKKIVFNVLKNPLIIGILLGILASFNQVAFPKAILTTADYLASMTLPLALICTGASIDVKGLFKINAVSLWASIGRLLVAPIFMVVIGKVLGITGIHLGIVLLMSSTPLATAAYAMIRGMGGNAVTAANIIGLTTFGSMFSSVTGLLLLNQIGWI